MKRLRTARTVEIERNSKLKRKYGITIKDKMSMEIKQNSRCAICSTHSSKLIRGLFIDHDHSSGAVRGLLCNSCNRGIGYLRDDSNLLARAKKYLDNDPTLFTSFSSQCL